MTREEMSSHRFTRREAIQRVSAMLGGVALVGQSGILEALAHPGPAQNTDVLSGADVALLDEIAETMLPETETPGAKAAGVGPFMALMVADAYSPEEQEIFREGLKKLDHTCHQMHGHDFIGASPADRLSLLERLDREQYNTMEAQEDDEDAPPHYFRMMKELALLGYFTSEIGYTRAMRYRETPGRFDPCVPYKPGEKAWANHA